MQDIKYPPIGIYEHYKSTIADKKRYQVLGFAKQTETNEILVVYSPLYTFNDGKEPQLFARPLEIFTELVNINNKIVPRFKYIGIEV